MKKLLSLLFAFGFVASLIAQPCSPDNTYTQAGIYPDTVTNLPQGAATQYYYAVITAVVPTDTVVGGFTATIDSIGVTNVEGLPTGFAWAANTTSAYFHGGDSGCIAIMGTPTIGMVGTHPLTIYILSHGKIAGTSMQLPDTIHGYKIVILDSTHVGIIDSKLYPFEIREAYPNPASDVFTLNISNPDAANIDIRIHDMLGQVVMSKNQKINAGENLVSFNINDIPEGIYFYTVSKGDLSITQKLIISR